VEEGSQNENSELRATDASMGNQDLVPTLHGGSSRRKNCEKKGGQISQRGPGSGRAERSTRVGRGLKPRNESAKMPKWENPSLGGCDRKGKCEPCGRGGGKLWRKSLRGKTHGQREIQAATTKQRTKKKMGRAGWSPVVSARAIRLAKRYVENREYREGRSKKNQIAQKKRTCREEKFKVKNANRIDAGSKTTVGIGVRNAVQNKDL